MNNPFKEVSRSLAKKLIVTVGILMAVGGSISWYMLISHGKKNLMNNAVAYTSSYSDLVKKSIRYNMLIFSRDQIQHIIESIGSTENIKRIRIFDSKGRIFYSSSNAEIGRSVNKASFACAGCHLDPDSPTREFAYGKRWTTVKTAEGYRILTFVDPIYNEPSCYTAACHMHSGKQRVLGVLEADFSLASVDAGIREQTLDTTVYAVVFLGISAIILYAVLRRFVLKPISTISRSMEKVAKGHLNQTIPVTSQDEMGMLAGTFNVMTKDLEAAKKKVDNWTQTLEEEIAKKTRELEESQDKLIQSEKLAALGRLTSDVAHRIRNPLTSIGGFAHKLERIVKGDKEKEYTGIVVTEVTRLEKILRDVLTFSREAGIRFERNSAEEVIRDVSSLYRNMCNDQSVHMEITRDENLPPVLMDKNQAKQALGNLLTNALDAMPGGGMLSIRACREELNNVIFLSIKVSDSGAGIPKEKLCLIFEPFFSTMGMYGTGLGLSITRKIMEEHGGFIRAESVVGKGSVFSLYFPYQSDEESLKIKCWEFKACGRDKDAAMKCPAFPNFGRICWAVAGTFCEGKAQGTFAQKYNDCKKCEFYRKVKSKEA